MFKLTPIVAASLLTVAMASIGVVRAGDDHEHVAHHHHGHAAPAAADEHAHHRAPPTSAPAQRLTLKLPDSALVDQNGMPQRLVSDVMGDRIVVANFVYTNCTTICPVVSTLFSQVQDKLGGLLDDQVRLVSMSVDPAHDTPARLKVYADSHGARPGWLWLTGQQPDVTAALKGFGTYTANFKDHPVVIMIGDGRSGQWIRYYGFQDPERLAAQVRDVLAARRAGNGTITTARKD